MTTEWSLDYGRRDEMKSVPSVDEHKIEQCLRRLDGADTTICGLTNVTDYCWLSCRGDPGKFIVEYVPSPLKYYGELGAVGGPIFLLARKQPVDRRALRIRWQSSPDVFVDIRAESVLKLSEVVVLFTTFFQTNSIHQDFTTIPKPRNGYLT